MNALQKIALHKTRLASRLTLAIIALTLVASVVLGRETTPRPTVVALAAPRGNQTAPSEPMPDLDLQRLNRMRTNDEVTDLFAPRTPALPAAPRTADSEPPPPPAPRAPPLPFTYLGKLIDGDKREVFIAHGDEHYSVEKDKTIGGEYRVESVTANAISFIYLPLGIRQKLSIPATE
ncbi:MAG: hypothetical protein ACT4PS_06240 [Betaproteobacteria bacterium]